MAKNIKTDADAVDTAAGSPANPTAGKKLLTVNEFKHAYSTSHTETYRLLAAGDIEAVKRGKNTLIVAESAEAWHRSLPRYAPRAAA